MIEWAQLSGSLRARGRSGSSTFICTCLALVSYVFLALFTSTAQQFAALRDVYSNTFGLDRPGILATAGFAFVSALALSLPFFQNPHGLVGRLKYTAVFCALSCSFCRLLAHSALRSSSLVIREAIFRRTHSMTRYVGISVLYERAR